MTRDILIVDDDALLRRSLAFNLENSGYKVRSAASAEDGFLAASHEKPALVLLDIGLPGIDGLEALKKFRDQMEIPVILLTARRRELDEILGLEMGADDYITKPFDLDVLLAHIKAVLRRFNTPSQPHLVETLQVGSLLIDPISHTAEIDGHNLELSPKEFDLLLLLARKSTQVVKIDEILTTVWGAEYTGEPQVVYVHIRWLREKIEKDPDNPVHIITVRSLGYKYLI